MAYFGDSLIYDLLFLCCSSLFAVYALCTYLQSQWTRKGIPFSNVHPIFGNIRDVIFGRKILTYVVRDFYLENKHKPFIGFFSFTQPMVMINDMELIKNVMVKDFSSFTDRNFSSSPSDTLNYHNLFTAKGQVWRNLRLKLTPTFTSGKMKKMFEFVDTCGKGLLTCLETEIDANGNVEVKDLHARYTIDVIATCAFGIEGNALKDRESVYGKYMRKAVTPDLCQLAVGILMFMAPSLIKKFNITNTKPDVAEFFRKTVWDTVKYREKNNVVRNDFLGLMMQLRKMGSLKNDEPLEDGEVIEESNEKIDLDGDKFVAQCFIFLLAGFETSSTTMSFALYELALNPDIQERVYEEITSVLEKHDGKVTYEAVQEMEYLHMVIQETLRKYPVLAFLDRQVTRPYRLPGTGIELARGESVMIPVIGLHYDPQLYPDPHRFDPERFSEEQCKARPPCSFLGFGDGPRICVGMRMGYMQTKVGLIYLLSKYNVSPSSLTKIPLALKNGVLPQVDGGVHLQLKKRIS